MSSDSLVPFTPASLVSEVKQISDEDLAKLGFTEKGKEDFKAYVYEANFWGGIASSITPPDVVEIREGFTDKDGVIHMLEYFPEEYTLAELNRLFPGWWTEDMKRSSLEEIIKLETVIVEGYLFIKYPTPQGTQVRKIWAIAGNDIKFKKGTKVPLDLANNFKGARTEWIRIAGKWLGIGLDLYHQKITAGLRSLFEDRIRAWGTYAGHWKTIAQSCEDGKSFRTMLKTMPSELQVMRITAALEFFPKDKNGVVWENFGKLSNANEKSRKQFEAWLTEVEEIAGKNKVKKEEEAKKTN